MIVFLTSLAHKSAAFQGHVNDCVYPHVSFGAILKNQEDKKWVASALSDGVSGLSFRKSRFKIKGDYDESIYKGIQEEKEKITKMLSQY